jgi:hypothetical protein
MSMKKIITIFLFTILTLGLSGCGIGNKIAVQENRTGGISVKENDTLLGWLKRGKTVQCTVTSSGDKIMVMVKNGKTRIEGLPFTPVESDRAAALPENGVSLFDGGTTYMWDKSTLLGLKLNQKSLSDLQSGTTTLSSREKTQDWEKMAKDWESAGDVYVCIEKELSDDLFTAPANVQFQDLTVIPQVGTDASGTPEEMLVSTTTPPIPDDIATPTAADSGESDAPVQE